MVGYWGDMATEFTAIDLETANPDAFSICQIGIAHFRDGELADEWMTYIDPEANFNRDNIAVHGITAAAVRGWPRLADVAGRLHEMLDGRIVISHSRFDRVALEQAFDRQDIPRLECDWLDSAKVAQRAWEGFAKRGFGLENLCRILGYRYQRHDALGDAKAAGVMVLAAVEQTGIPLERWLQQAELPIADGPRLPIRPLAADPGARQASPSPTARPENRLFSPEVLHRLSENWASERENRQ